MCYLLVDKWVLLFIISGVLGETHSLYLCILIRLRLKISFLAAVLYPMVKVLLGVLVDRLGHAFRVVAKHVG